MPQSRMGKRKKIKGYVELVYSGEAPLELQGEDISTNGIAVIVPLEHRAVDKIRQYFQKVATISHSRLSEPIPGVLHRVEKISKNKLKWIYSFNRKAKNI